LTDPLDAVRDLRDATQELIEDSVTELRKLFDL
jgi:hypothetical protein